jgi:hypothetical protein
MMDMKNPTPLELPPIVDLVRGRLEAVRESISRELCTIPTPIPGCDVNFNRLLEDRSKVVDELQRFTRLTAQGPSRAALLDFVRASEWLDQSTRERIMQLHCIDRDG